jgi:hypothetical protein
MNVRSFTISVVRAITPPFEGFVLNAAILPEEMEFSLNSVRTTSSACPLIEIYDPVKKHFG